VPERDERLQSAARPTVPDVAYLGGKIRGAKVEKIHLKIFKLNGLHPSPSHQIRPDQL
jgi:hypothetical protein